MARPVCLGDALGRRPGRRPDAGTAGRQGQPQERARFPPPFSDGDRGRGLHERVREGPLPQMRQRPHPAMGPRGRWRPPLEVRVLRQDLHAGNGCVLSGRDAQTHAERRYPRPREDKWRVTRFAGSPSSPSHSLSGTPGRMGILLDRSPSACPKSYHSWFSST